MRMHVVAVSLLSCFACGGGQRAAAPAVATVVTPATPAEVTAAAETALEQYRQAYLVRSMDALSPLYEQSDALVVVHQGKRTVGWPAISAELTVLLGRSSDIRLTVSAVRVVALGPEGVAITATVARSVSDRVTTVATNGVLTLVLRRSGDTWQIVSEHFSYPPRL